MLITTILAFLLTISIVVVFHEFGHYLACRLFGIRVERFSLGFGKVLLRLKDRRKTEWVVSAIPLGGYVKPYSIQEEKPDGSASFTSTATSILTESSHSSNTGSAPARPKDYGQSIESKTAFQRFVVFAAGPFFSFLLSVLVFCALGWIGTKDIAPVLDTPNPESAVAHAGLTGGEHITAVNDTPVRSWSELNMQLLNVLSLGGDLKLSYIPTDQDKSATPRNIIMHFETFGGKLEKTDLVRDAGFAPDLGRAVFQETVPGSPAERAGLQTGDIVYGTCNGKAIKLNQFLDLVKKNPEKPLCLTLLRDGRELNVQITPEAHETDTSRYGQIGVRLTSEAKTTLVRYGFLEGITQGIYKTVDLTVMSFKFLGKIITGDMSYKNLGGAITIADYSGKAAQSGILSLMSFIGLISLSIGALNLVPIPGLDGGQMLLCVIEMIRRRPLSQKAYTKLTNFGFALIFVIFILALGNDITRLL